MVPAEACYVTTAHGWEEEVLKQLEESQAAGHPVAQQDCRHQKGFPTQVLERHQQKPRGRVCRRLASPEHEGLEQRHESPAGEARGPEVRAESLHPRRQSFELRRQLEYKTQWRGGLLVSVPPQNTSRKCPECRHTAAENRKRQAKFVCVRCGFSAHADFVGAVNIKEAGLALLACSEPSPEARASWQEPTEATRVQACA